MPNTEEILINPGDWLKITHPPKEEGGDGEIVYVRIKATNPGASANPNTIPIGPSWSDTIQLDAFNGLGIKRALKWHNCWSFGNGVESNRIGDIFNAPQITPGVKVSTVFEEYKEERRQHGLIYSGLYNSTSGKQFLLSESMEYLRIQNHLFLKHIDLILQINKEVL